MPTYSALTTLPGAEAAQSLAAAMERMDPEPTGVGVFEIEDGSGLWEVGGYFLEPPDGVMLEVLATAFGARPFALSELPEIDWVAKVRRELAPVEVLNADLAERHARFRVRAVEGTRAQFYDVS